MCVKKTNKFITTVFNMFVAVIVSMLLGLLLNNICSYQWIIVGLVSVCAVLTEHFLTLYPSCILKYITLTQKGDTDEKNS